MDRPTNRLTAQLADRGAERQTDRQRKGGKERGTVQRLSHYSEVCSFMMEKFVG